MESRWSNRTVCLTVDNMGEASAIGAGRIDGPIADHPGLVVGQPRILGLLAKYAVPATFFVEGWNGIHHPERVAELVERGHEVALHGWVHERWSSLDADQAEVLLRKGRSALAAAGATVQGFRAPGGDAGEHTAELLCQLGFEYDSSEAASPVPSVLEGGLIRVPFVWPLVDWLYAGRFAPVASAAGLEAHLRLALDDVLAIQDAVPVLVFHLTVSALESDRFDALERIVSSLVNGGADLRTVGDVARRVKLSTATHSGS